MNRATRSDSWVRNPDNSLGYTCSLITGCLNHVNGLCKGGGFPCFAYKLANGRLKQRYLANRKLPLHALPYSTKREDPFYPRFWMDRTVRLDDFLRRARKPVGVFLDIMGEWLGDWVPESWINWHFELMRRYPQHRFYTLTKQPQNLIKWSFPDNCWVGVTATNDLSYTEAFALLSLIKARVKFISFEPLLGKISDTGAFMKASGINWLIIGALTPYSPKTAPKIEWVEEIVRVANKADIPVFLKDNLSPLFAEHLTIKDKWAQAKDFGRGGLWKQEMPNAISLSTASSCPPAPPQPPI